MTTENKISSKNWKQKFQKSVTDLNVPKVTGSQKTDFDKGVKVGAVSASMVILDELYDKGLISKYRRLQLIGLFSNASVKSE